eukprot:gene18843-21089_t
MAAHAPEPAATRPSAAGLRENIAARVCRRAEVLCPPARCRGAVGGGSAAPTDRLRRPAPGGGGAARRAGHEASAAGGVDARDSERCGG